MKQTMFVSVLTLILILAVGGDLSSKNHPDGYQEIVKPSGDDHPWGGEQFTEPDPLRSSKWDNFNITGYALIDYLFQAYIDSYVAEQISKGMKTGAGSTQITADSGTIISNDTDQPENRIGR